MGMGIITLHGHQTCDELNARNDYCTLSDAVQIHIHHLFIIFHGTLSSLAIKTP